MATALSTGFNISPTPTAGNGAYGSVPGQVNAPPSIWSQLLGSLPGIGGATGAATGDITSMLSGLLSPSTQGAITNQAASRGVTLGQPNSPISNEIGLGLTGQTSEGLQNQGLSSLMNLIGTVGSQQQNPALLTDIAQSNAINAAAPNPQAAANQLLSLFQQYQQQMNPAGGRSTTFNPAGNFGGGSAGGAFSDFPDANPSIMSQNYLNNILNSPVGPY